MALRANWVIPLQAPPVIALPPQPRVTRLINPCVWEQQIQRASLCTTPGPMQTVAREGFWCSAATVCIGPGANSGQGGVLVLGGLQNVGRIQLTLASNSLATSGQGSDFILFNIGTPAPEPSTAVPMIIGCFAGVVVLRRRRRYRGLA